MSLTTRRLLFVIAPFRALAADAAEPQLAIGFFEAESPAINFAAAVRHTAQSADAAGWLVLPGDLPLVQPATLQAMAQVLLDQRAVVAWPEFAGERGHPVAFGRDCLEGLLALSGEKGAAPVVRHWAQQGRGLAVPVQDEGVVTDIDTVQALERAEALLAKTQVHRGVGGR